MSVDQSFAYAYHPETGVSTGIINLLKDPLDKGKYQLWANCTVKEPLKPKFGFEVIFNKDLDNWEYIENHIGKKGYINDQPYEVKKLGPLPEGFSIQLSFEYTKQAREELLSNICRIILNSTDYLLMPDYELENEDKELLINFRKIIRNLDKQEDYPWLDKEINEIIPTWPLKTKKCPYNV